ncbi:AraC family transcriptional regulator [Paraburkholderia sp. MMS20-SJTR3]|uniref:AraC family transcriptional regulator n=1 Tax=Paraburkholderia sejongensis TaxID=2886946 RepID=A0ABS8K156_9BURK|nr:AraC family transcriptional regulator [Paraburkholderia sp. MMS20-SJTR3]MCC8395903.1 AraC family transcriptional regulator [Paraburkholderia sp. MMS20-SJTR3]
MSSKLPLQNERIYAPYKIAALVEVLGEQGIAPEDILKGSGVEVDSIYDASALTSVRQYAAVCRNAISLSCSPATPFIVGSRLHLSAYGMYGYALMSCLSLRDYFRLGVKYHRLATPTLTIEWTEYADEGIWTFPDAFTSSTSKELNEFLIEQQFTQHVTHLQDVAGRSCPPTKACFSYPAPEHAELYPQYLGCPCYFEQPQCELHYDSGILEQRPQLAHRLTATLLQETCDRLIGQAKTSVGVSGEVYQLMMRTPGEFPDMESAAAMLKMTSRTLRRRLEAEGTSFVAIVDDVRCSLATEYLKTTRMSTDDIAMLLGFSDGANFRRALKRWTGKGPNELRG